MLEHGPGEHLHHAEQAPERERRIWTDPRTWVTGETLTSTLFNTHIRDDLKWIGGSDAFVTTPPTSPVDRQLWVYPVDAVNGIVWPFRYAASSANTDKWESFGGMPVILDSGSTSVTSAAYADPAALLSFVVPRGGVYKAKWTGFLTPAAGATAHLALKRGATATSDADSVNPQARTNAVSGARASGQVTLSALDTLKLQAKVSTGTLTIDSQTLLVVPARVS